MNRAEWGVLKEKLASAIATKTRAEWCALMEGTDVCFAPVLDFDEAPKHPHNIARETFVEIDGVTQPAPAPRFSKTPGRIQSGPPGVGADTDSALADWGFTLAEIEALRAAGAA
jgi:alpha-methylacyl-CoA racemase